MNMDGRGGCRQKTRWAVEGKVRKLSAGGRKALVMECVVGSAL